jgi:hypothetical protein
MSQCSVGHLEAEDQEEKLSISAKLQKLSAEVGWLNRSTLGLGENLPRFQIRQQTR